MRTIHHKLLRDIWHLKGQVAAIGVVIAAGVMMLIVSVTSLDAVRVSQARFYDSHQFADLFVALVRAPERMAERLREQPGINQLQSRVQAPVRLDVADYPDPVRGVVLSIPDGRQPLLNRLFLRSGSLPDSGRSDQVLVSEPFAEAHGLEIGDRLVATIYGRLETLTISGVALSPEFVYQIGPADIMPDHERYAVLWMNRTALGHALGMDGAFNGLLVTLQAGADARMVIDALDALLARYGSAGAYARDDQVSHRFLSEEIAQLQVMAVVLPAIFLGVAAFLLSVLMARIVRTQRQQIAVLKAFGYRNSEIALHYGLFTGLVVALGALAGVLAGAWAADAMAGLYAQYFRFPEMYSRLQPRVVALAVLIAGTAAFAGTYRSVYAAVRLAPAEAMRPPAPERFRRGWLEGSALGRRLYQPTRIILRNLSRHRLKALFSVLGIGLSGALLVLGSNQFSAIDQMLDQQYRQVMRMDLQLSYTDPTPERAAAELRAEPGVYHVESFRSVPVRLTNGRREYRTSIQGLEAEPQLRRLVDRQGRPLVLPPEGLVMTGYLARHLGVAAGDTLQVEVMEGHRRVVRAALAGIVDEPIGVGAYMDRRALNRLLREGPAVSGAWLLIDRDAQETLFARLWELPRVAGISLIRDAERNLRGYIEDTVLGFMMVLLGLAGSIAFAVSYNNARISFAERARELATLRVMGFTGGEVAWILLGEIALLTLLAIPLGWALGTGLSYLLVQSLSIDLYRIPFVVSSRTFAFSAAGVLLAAALSVVLIAVRLRRLDMVSALKTVE